jgi:hypothetical protein
MTVLMGLLEVDGLRPLPFVLSYPRLNCGMTHMSFLRIFVYFVDVAIACRFTCVSEVKLKLLPTVKGDIQAQPGELLVRLRAHYFISSIVSLSTIVSVVSI